MKRKITITDALEQLDNKDSAARESQQLKLPEGITPEFLEVLHAVLSEYDETLKGLKDR